MRKIDRLWLVGKVALIAALGFYCVRSRHSIRKVRQGSRPSVSEPSPASFSGAEIGHLRSLDGTTPWGDRVVSPQTWRGIGAFVIRGDQFDADMRTWNQIASALGSDSSIGLRGFCDGEQCLSRMRGLALRPRFQVVGAGAYSTMRLLLLAKRMGVAVIYMPLTGNSGVQYERWSDVAKKPGQLEGFLRRSEKDQ